jgi:poly(hydroxyalkanoate) depolymerase family esterase
MARGRAWVAALVALAAAGAEAAAAAGPRVLVAGDQAAVAASGRVVLRATAPRATRLGLRVLVLDGRRRVSLTSPPRRVARVRRSARVVLRLSRRGRAIVAADRAACRATRLTVVVTRRESAPRRLGFLLAPAGGCATAPPPAPAGSEEPARAEWPASGTARLTHHRMPATDAYPGREYYVYAPSRPVDALVVYLHGCTQPALEAAKGTRWNELADQRGFVVAYPDQRVPEGLADAGDGSKARCWNPGQSEALPRDHGEIGTVAEITRRVAREHGIAPGRVFVAGISGGALMATTMAVVYPDLYAAVGHVENCGYSCGDADGELAYRRMGDHARVVPAMIVNGSADFLINPALAETAVTQWVGTNDRADNGARDDSVPRTPTTVTTTGGSPQPSPDGELCADDLAHHNPCPGGVLGPYPVTVRDYAGVVQAWTVHGLSHNYPGGSAEGSFTDPYGPNITPPLFDFFERAAARRSAAP